MRRHCDILTFKQSSRQSYLRLPKVDFLKIVRSCCLLTKFQKIQLTFRCNFTFILQNRIYEPGPLLIFGISSFICGGIALFLPETLDRPLPETLEEGNNLHKTKPIRSSRADSPYIAGERNLAMETQLTLKANPMIELSFVRETPSTFVQHAGLHSVLRHRLLRQLLRCQFPGLIENLTLTLHQTLYPTLNLT